MPPASTAPRSTCTSPQLTWPSTRPLERTSRNSLMSAFSASVPETSISVETTLPLIAPDGRCGSIGRSHRPPPRRRQSWRRAPRWLPSPSRLHRYRRISGAPSRNPLIVIALTPRAFDSPSVEQLPSLVTVIFLGGQQ